MIEKLEEIHSRYLDIEEKLSDPTVASDMKQFTKLNKEYSSLKEVNQAYLSYKDILDNIESSKAMLNDSDQEMRDMAKEELQELEKSKNALDEKLKVLLIPKDPDDAKDVIMEIRSGTGGDEASIFAGDLYRMYSKYFESKKWKVEVLDINEGSVGGYNKIVLEIFGNDVFGHLKFESGAHRVQRVPKTESQGRVHTSAATVAILPKFEEEDIDVKKDDLRTDTFRASGAGGQHVNKTESAVRVRHLPTGITAECQQERSQHMNREKALQMLKSRLYQKELEKQLAEKDSVEANKMKNEWGSQIRSYVLDDRRVKDHRTNFMTTNTDAVLNGELDGFLKAYLMWLGKDK